MLLIPCPWCGPRDEIEFHYGGEAHIARPPDPDALDDRAWADYLFMRSNPKGPFAARRPDRPQPSVALRVRWRGIRRPSRRYARFRPAREWRAARRAQLQIPPAARHLSRR